MPIVHGIASQLLLGRASAAVPRRARSSSSSRRARRSARRSAPGHRRGCGRRSRTAPDRRRRRPDTRRAGSGRGRSGSAARRCGATTSASAGSSGWAALNGDRFSVIPTCSAPPPATPRCPARGRAAGGGRRRRPPAARCAGRVDAGGVAEQRRAPRLVERRPGRHPIAERLEHRRGVLGEPVRGVAVRPAASVLERLRQVPVVQRHPGSDVVLEQRVDQPRVEVDPGRVDRAAVGAHPRPRHREAVRVESEIGHQCHVVGHPAVVVAGGLAGVATDHGAGHAAERVPDRVGAPVGVASPPRSGTRRSRFPTRSRRGRSMWSGEVAGARCGHASSMGHGAAHRSRSPARTITPEMGVTGNTRIRVVDAALDLFGTRGVDAVSLDEIAREVGVRKQTVLYWFPSKDDLVDAVLETAAAELAVVIDAAVRSAPDDPLDRIDAVVRAVFRPAVRRPALLGLVREVGRLPAPQAARLREHVAPLVERADRLPRRRDGTGTPAPRRPGTGRRARVRDGHRHRHRAGGVAGRRLERRRHRPAPAPRRAPGLPPRRPRAGLIRGHLPGLCHRKRRDRRHR